MEKFIVSARKYRPQDFGSVVGQQHITTTLKNAILNNTLAHAFLFCGPRGVGKTTCARILAKTINCENLQPDGEACNRCPSCVAFNNGSSLNILELDAASNNSVDDIRELVTQVRFAPQEGKSRIYIIDEVHMLSSAAFNAFLKTLEEPPSYAKFILATTEKHKILPTILSRCQIFDFKRIKVSDTVAHLEAIASKEKIDADRASLQLIAQKSEGCMRDSLSLLDKIVSFTEGSLSYATTLEHLNLLDEDYLFKLLEALHAQDLPTALVLFDEILEKGFEGDTVLGGLAECLRNLLVSKDAKAAVLLDVVEGMQERYAETAAHFSLSFLVTVLNLVAEAEVQYKLARNKRLHVEMALIKICYVQQALELAVQDDKPAVSFKKRATGNPVAIGRKALKKESPDLPKKASLKIVSEAPISMVTENESPAVVYKKSEVPHNKIEPQIIPRSADEAATPTSVVADTELAEPPKKQPNILQKLRERQVKNLQQNSETVAQPLVWQQVLDLWQAVCQQQESDEKFSVSAAMNRSTLEQKSESHINIVCLAGVDQKIIEPVAIDFLEQVKSRFHNKKITIGFSIAAGDGPPAEIEMKHRPAIERYQQLSADYPLVEELRKKLNLELLR